jgi:hypothetical protein
MKTNMHFWSYFAQFFLQLETFQTEVVEKIKTYVFCSITSFQILRRLWDKVEKYCRAGQATDEDIAQAHCMLDT